MEFKENELDEILEVHLQKKEKVAIYKPRVLANIVNGIVNFKATWSWWAFFGTWGFLLYRKMYLQAAIFFIVSVLLQDFGFIVMIFAGVSAFYFYTKKLEKDLQIAGYKDREFSQFLESLRNLGGYHSWVVWVAVIFNLILLIFFNISIIGFFLFKYS